MCTPISFINLFVVLDSEIVHNGDRLFHDIPSGQNSGFKVSFSSCLLNKFELPVVSLYAITTTIWLVIWLLAKY